MNVAVLKVKMSLFVCHTNDRTQREKCHPTAMQLIAAEFASSWMEIKNKLSQNIWGANLSHRVHATITPSFEPKNGRNLLAARLQISHAHTKPFITYHGNDNAYWYLNTAKHSKRPSALNDIFMANGAHNCRNKVRTHTHPQPNPKIFRRNRWKCLSTVPFLFRIRHSSQKLTFFGTFFN